MTPFQRSLDRYLTAEPPDDSWWFEAIAEKLTCTQEVFEKYETQIDAWSLRLFLKTDWPITKKDVERAAAIINRLLKNKQ